MFCAWTIVHSLSAAAAPQRRQSLAERQRKREGRRWCPSERTWSSSISVNSLIRSLMSETPPTTVLKADKFIVAKHS